MTYDSSFMIAGLEFNDIQGVDLQFSIQTMHVCGFCQITCSMSLVVPPAPAPNFWKWTLRLLWTIRSAPEKRGTNLDSQGVGVECQPEPPGKKLRSSSDERDERCGIYLAREINLRDQNAHCTPCVPQSQATYRFSGKTYLLR
jgi:hypothetical protein